MSDLFPELSETERQMLGLGQPDSCPYRCARCQHEDDVPDVVIAGFAASAGLKPGRMPRLVCPNCGGSFRHVR